jgi:hypothetical protein
MALGNNDYGASPPFGYVAGTTNVLILTPNSLGSTLVGILNPGINGWPLIIYNASSTAQITLANQQAASAYSQFTCPLGVSYVIQPQAKLFILYLNGIGWTI